MEMKKGYNGVRLSIESSIICLYLAFTYFVDGTIASAIQHNES